MSSSHYPKPTTRRLRVYAFDPAASVDLETAVVNSAVITLPWERPWEHDLEIGPANDYLEVVDYDPNYGYFFEPVDLNNPHLLAQDGLTPSEGNPQFHQQLVFAVAMKTIRNFERALGRPVFWSQATDDPRVVEKRNGKGKGERYPNFVKRLRIYPHALQDKNAFFSPAKAALLFGYFKGPPRFDGHDGDWVFTCLSQDIVTHETVHAILHGMRSRNIEATNPDSLAFHEGFADIVALFQHFTMKNVLTHQLGKSGGVLRSASLLTGLASQFGEATGHNGPLRSAIELLRKEQISTDQTGASVARKLSNALKPHDRGQYLVAAVFDAFITIYERRTADLFTIAARRPGDNELPEQLITRLAEEAAKIADSFLGICVRALDYLPPGTSTFGDYLRAMITADMELVPDDPHNYRVALAESFRKREIPVDGCASYAPIALAWQNPDTSDYLAKMKADNAKAIKRDYRQGLDQNQLFADALHRMKFFAQLSGQPETKSKAMKESATAYFDQPIASQNLRDEAMKVVSHNQWMLYDWMQAPSPSLFQERMWESLLGIRTLPLEAAIDRDACGSDFLCPLSIKARYYASINDAINAMDIQWKRWEKEEKRLKILDELRIIWEQALPGHTGPIHLPVFDVHTVRISRRVGPSGIELFQMIAQITQRRAGFFDKDEQKKHDSGERSLWMQAKSGDKATRPDFWFRGGATIIVDLRNGEIQHVVRQRIDNEWRLEGQRRFILNDDTALTMAAMNGGSGGNGAAETKSTFMRPVTGWEGEPFAFIHGETE